MIIVGLVLIFLDFFSKAYVYHVLSLDNSCVEFCKSGIPVFQNFAGIDFTITLALNRGAAWGFFANFQTVLLAVRVVVILGMFVYLFFLNKNPSYQFPLILIIAGAIGNVIDYFLYRYVIDFLSFNLWGYHFPVFNFADTFITIGVFLLILVGMFNKKGVEKPLFGPVRKHHD